MTLERLLVISGKSLFVRSLGHLPRKTSIPLCPNTVYGSASASDSRAFQSTLICKYLTFRLQIYGFTLDILFNLRHVS